MKFQRQIGAFIAFGIILFPISAKALDQQMEEDIRTIYERKAEILTGDRVDVEAAVAEAEKRNSDDAVFVNRLKHLNTGQLTENTMDKQDLIAQIPDAYSRTSDSEATITIKEIKDGAQPDEAVVTYVLSYKATLKQQDVYSRTIKSDMTLVSQCTDTVRRNDDGVIRTTRSECDGALQNSQPEIIEQDQ